MGADTPSLLILSPPIALVALVIFCAGISTLVSLLGPTPAKSATDGSKKAYACGENVTNPVLQPNYAEFYPFAFFFTILHVVTLIIATAPLHRIEEIAVVAVYVAGALIGLYILFRKGTEDGTVAQDTDLGKN